MQLAKRLALAVLSGGLLILSFPWARQGWLAYLALIPLLAVVYDVRPRQSFGYGWITGTVFFGGLCYWVGIYGALPWLIMAVGIGACFGLAAAASGWLARRLGPATRILALPALWAGLEVLRSETGVYSYPFGVLGYSQAGFRPALGLAAIIGVYGLSWLIVTVNVGLIELARARLSGRSDGAGPAVVALVLAIAAIGLGGWAVPRVAGDAVPTLRVALVQASIPQDEKWLTTQRDRIMTEYETLVQRAARGRPDLIVLPEAALPAYVEKDSPLYEELAAWAREAKTPILAGVPLIKNNRAYNTAVLFDASGATQASYAKMIPTLFGEQVPWRPLTEFIYPMFRSIGDITAGGTQTVFRLPGKGNRLTFGVLICSESFYQNLARSAVARGSEVLLVLTNDAWFHDSSEAALHFDMTSLRAAETGLYVAQTANTGISGLFEPSGRPERTLGLGEKDVIFAELRARRAATAYTAGGWLFPYILAGLAAVLVGRDLAGERLHKATKG